MAFTACARTRLINSVAAALLGVPLWAGAVSAQEAPEAGADTAGAGQAQPAEETAQDAGGQSSSGVIDNALLATIGGVEIRNSDLLTAIGALPPPLSAQPPEIVASLALQQLLLREAIVQKARSENLAQDPEVQSLVSQATQAAEKSALVQVWLRRELQDRVTPAAVEQAHAALQAVTSDDVPPLDQVRSQIEESLRRLAVKDIEASLLTGADITFYGPDGKPRSGQQDAGGAGSDTGQPPEGAAMGQADADQAGAAGQDADAPADPASPEDGTSGAQTGN